MGEKIVSSYLLTNTPDQAITGNLNFTGTITARGNNTKGGAGYFDFLQVTNTS
jgi:hypothetical protein